MTGAGRPGAVDAPSRAEGWLAGLGFAMLVANGVLVGLFGLLYNPLYLDVVPLPVGAVLTVLVLPWLVARAADIDRRTSVAAAPLVAWGAVVAGLGITGPGGDVLLPPTWQTVLLCVGGLGSGMWALNRASEGR